MPTSHERATEDVQRVAPVEGLPPYEQALYPRFLHYWQYLGTGTSCRLWSGPGHTYVPAEDLVDSPIDYEFRFIRPAEAIEAIPDVRTALYRLRGESRGLLYVGISSNPLRRWPEHAAEKQWWSEVTDLSMQWFESRAAALKAEVEAIRTERPLYNVQHNDVAV